ncbi:AraC family transcriptional regulator [Priestia megaterium]|uniref:AraC family transcriptional regulator n=1 Tax=Priestia megaterium TaxID=1404 RepID=UPI001BEC49CA|nr:AraC family transcriptional regulator [Priestia megaterium]MBT2259183.1 AraC family transcriptional regulator [Priestia megaterium]
MKNKQIDKEKVRYLCRLLFDLTKISVMYVDNSDEIQAEFSSHYIINPFYNDKRRLLTQLLTYPKYISVPVLQPTNNLENYIVVPVVDKKDNIGSILIGPVLYREIEEETVIGLMKDSDLPIKKKADLLHYYSCVPVMDKMTLIRAGTLIHYFIYGKEINITEIIEQGLPQNHPSLHVRSHLDKTLAKRRQNDLIHHDLMIERNFFQCIKDGNKEKLVEMLENYESLFEGEGVLAKSSYLRSQKNSIICLIAAATRSAIDGGLNPELALTLSDLYIQQIEESHEIQEVIAIRNKSMYDFVEKVHTNKAAGYSRPIMLCLNYIFNHIYQNISLEQLAEKSELHPNYLSKIFKKEVGKSVSQYIQEQRIEEAKKLLQLSNYTISEISTLLNFHDQSYFTTTFKKVLGVTPKQYRNNQ